MALFITLGLISRPSAKMLSLAQHPDYAQHLSVYAVSCTVMLHKVHIPYLTLPPDLHPLYRGTIQGPLYVELVLQNYVQCFILHQTHIYVHRFKTDKKKSSGNALTIYLQSIR
jgi:hypothetical protein